MEVALPIDLVDHRTRRNAAPASPRTISAQAHASASLPDCGATSTLWPASVGSTRRRLNAGSLPSSRVTLRKYACPSTATAGKSTRGGFGKSVRTFALVFIRIGRKLDVEA